MLRDNVKHLETVTQIGRMGLWGLPGIILAFGLNYIIATYSSFDVYFSFFLVLIITSAFNYFIIEEVVFKGPKKNKQMKRIKGYLLIIILTKAGEWAVYSSFIKFWGMYFLFAQFVTSVLFLLIKYFSFKKIMG